MSTLVATTITTANGTTNMTVSSGNSSGGGLVVFANGNGLVLQGNSSSNVMTMNTSSVSVGNTISNLVINSTAIAITGNSTSNCLISNGNILINNTAINPNQGMKNRIINGAMTIWQRGTSGFGPGGYGADRWYLDGVSATSQRSTDVPSGFLYSNEWGYPGTASCSLRQRIESIHCVDLVGQSITVSFWAKSTAGTTALTYDLHYANSTDNFSAITSINSDIVSASPSGSWTYYSFTVKNLPSGAANGIQLSINRATGGSATTRITGIQLEKGTTASAFEFRNYTIELALCHRYYYIMNASQQFTNFSIGRSYSATQGTACVTLPVPMRTLPTGAAPAATNFTYGLSSITPVTNYTANYHIMEIAVVGAFTSGGAFAVEANNTNAYISWSAEL